MEELKKLIKTLEEVGKVAGGSLLDLNDEANLETRLYQLVKGAGTITEEEAQIQLYGSSGRHSAFKMLKSRVKKKLYNQLHFLDFDNTKKYTKLKAAELKCNTLLTEALVLNKLDVWQLREKLALQVVKLGKEAELTGCLIRALSMLRVIYSFDSFDKKKYHQISKEIEHYNELNYKEEKANTLYHHIIIETRQGVKNRAEKYDFMNKCTDELYQLWKDTGSSLIFSKYYVGKTVVLESSGNRDELIKHLLKSENEYQDGRINPYHFSYERNLYALTYALLKNKQYEDGLRVAEKLKSIMEPLNQNWFAHIENYFMLAVHSKNYRKAKEILQEVFANPFFENNVQSAKERWYLFHDFFNFIEGGESIISPDLKLYHITHDKNGYNVWLVILEFIRHIVSKDVELISNQTENLRKYTINHFSADADQRTRVFLKLLQIAGQNFQSVKVCRRKAQYLLDKLNRTPIAGDAYAEVEIIPYEDLWEIMLQKLGAGK